jgi:hypothetical protein
VRWTDAELIGHQETFEDDVDDKGELTVLLLDRATRAANGRIPSCSTTRAANRPNAELIAPRARRSDAD